MTSLYLVDSDKASIFAAGDQWKSTFKDHFINFYIGGACTNHLHSTPIIEQVNILRQLVIDIIEGC